MEARGSTVFYRSFYEAIKVQPKEIQADLYNALLEYSFTGTIPETDNCIVQSFFLLMKPQIDANNKRYESGKKGGRPKDEKTETNGFKENKKVKTNGFENNENSKPVVLKKTKWLAILKNLM